MCPRTRQAILRFRHPWRRAAGVEPRQRIRDEALEPARGDYRRSLHNEHRRSDGRVSRSFGVQIGCCRSISARSQCQNDRVSEGLGIRSRFTREPGDVIYRVQHCLDRRYLPRSETGDQRCVQRRCLYRAQTSPWSMSSKRSKPTLVCRWSQISPPNSMWRSKLSECAKR